jgi:hypothetical protein
MQLLCADNPSTPDGRLGCGAPGVQQGEKKKTEINKKGQGIIGA